MRAAFAPLAAVAIVVALGATARAQSVGVVVTGEEMLQSPLRAQLELWLRAHGHEPVASPLEPNELNSLVDCFVMEDMSCAQKIVEHAKADAVLYVRVEAVSTAKSRDVTLDMHYFVKDSPVVKQHSTCEGCTDEAMHNAAEAAVAQLVPAEAPRTKVVPSPDVVVVHQTVHRSRTVPALVTGIGVASLIAGGVFYLTSEKDDGTQLYYRDTKPLGIGLGVGGAVLIGAGVILFLREPPRNAGPNVAVTPQGGFIGWTGAF
jgi:hypothetical protein